MDRTETLHAEAAALRATVARLDPLLRAAPDLTRTAGNGSVWPIRDAAVHLVVCANVYTELANGMPSPVTSADPDDLAALSASLNADIPETAPDKVAALVTDAVDRYVDTVTRRLGCDPVAWHCGITLDLAQLTGVVLSEALLHGYDIACALGAPWPIEPTHALLTVGAMAPLLPIVVAPAAAGHNGAYGLDIGGAQLTVRFTDGQVAAEPLGGPVDAEIYADPVAFLLVFTGRLSPWTAIALGLIRAAGPRPDLALGFPALFRFP